MRIAEHLGLVKRFLIGHRPDRFDICFFSAESGARTGTESWDFRLGVTSGQKPPNPGSTAAYTPVNTR